MKISFSQDVHFSQNFIDRLYFNPSEIGLINNGDYRFSIQRKSQWSSVSIPFSTFSTSFESKNFYKKINLGVGFLNDKSGDAKLMLNQLNVSLSTSFKILKINTFSIGILGGFGQKTIDYNDLIFEENENLLSDEFIFPDIALGLNYTINQNQIFSYKIGFSSYHFNLPNNSFNKDQLSKLQIKNNMNLVVNYKLSENNKLVSEIIYTKQSTQKEILLGFRPIIDLDRIILFPLVYYRINDAPIIGAGIEKDNIQVNISYDINTSDLSRASNYRSGFEFSIIYIWNQRKKERKKEKEEKCPKYL